MANKMTNITPSAIHLEDHAISVSLEMVMQRSIGYANPECSNAERVIRDFDLSPNDPLSFYAMFDELIITVAITA